MIVDTGKEIMVQYLAGDSPSWLGSIAIGSDSTAAQTTDTRLGFEFGRFPVEFTQGDTTNDKVYVRATVPIEAVGEIHEIGIWSQPHNTATNNASLMLLDFDSGNRDYTGGADESTDVRVSSLSRKLSFGGSGTDSITAANFYDDLSGYDVTDQLSLAYFAYGAGISDVTVRIKTDASNYFEYSFTPSSTAAYHVESWARSAMTATGSPDWASVGELEFEATATGAQDITFDGFRLEDTDEYTDFKLVARAIVSPAEQATANRETEIEYTIDLTL